MQSGLLIYLFAVDRGFNEGDRFFAVDPVGVTVIGGPHFWPRASMQRIMKKALFSIYDFIKHIPSALLSRSGKVFYSGRRAFSFRSNLYVLGVNPGGAPEDYDVETVDGHTHDVLRHFADDWSAYSG